MPLYFAYGSNLWSGRVGQNNRKVTFKTQAKLKGYKLTFSYPNQRWKGHVANIVQDDNSEVWGALWDVDEDTLNDIDKQEGVLAGIYERVDLKVEVDDQTLDCIGYQQKAEIREKYHEPGAKPSVPYLQMIIRGAKENNLPEEYVKNLEQIEDNGYNGQVDLDADLSIVE